MSRVPLKAIAVALLFCLGLLVPADADAASLGFVPDPAVGFALDGAVEISDDVGGLLIANAFGAALGASGVAGLTDNAFDLLVVGDSLGGVAPTASLFIDGADGSVTGDLAGYFATSDFIELLFNVTSDDFGLFGGRLLMVVTGDFSAAVFATDASVVINPAVAPIPLPASLPLLAGALAAVAAMRRRRA